MNGSAGTCSLLCFQVLIGSVNLDGLKIFASMAQFTSVDKSTSITRGDTIVWHTLPNSSNQS